MGRKSEYAPFVEEYLRNIELLSGWIRRMEDGAARAATQDERGGMLFQSYEWQYMVADFENQIEEMRRLAAKNEPDAEPF